ncbi:leucine-rich repeat receptor-like protein kinase [Musa troglodytarum]|uniref:non-specific serine/threonine protein kinase n=1 Tax=Musa troglodytarum TaxID=320322 RepID=A0A9E7KUQ6_9LILI|nr:leucine-rich repeat receptor-like protein kinase [Musa troglodytarum]URE27875.1 leucine-rich repeat receptor-like protein kinase [Musa troglodytarum]
MTSDLRLLCFRKVAMMKFLGHTPLDRVILDSDYFWTNKSDSEKSDAFVVGLKRFADLTLRCADLYVVCNDAISSDLMVLVHILCRHKQRYLLPSSPTLRTEGRAEIIISLNPQPISFRRSHLPMVRLKGFLLLFIIIAGLHQGSSKTYPADVSALKSLSSQWKNTPPSWSNAGDPCGDSGEPWEGVNCSNSRVTEIKLFTMGLEGTLSREIGNLTNLEVLDLSHNRNLSGALPSSIGMLKQLKILRLLDCGFSGSIPNEIGSLSRLEILALNSNQFSGRIPASLGSLSNLNYLDLADNQLTGPLPTSASEGSGLDQLLDTEHFHLNKNQLSGSIPNDLFSSNMKVIHILLDSNNLTGAIPESIGLVQSLHVLRLDNNSLNGSVPSSISNLTKLDVLNLANNNLGGPMPNLTGMHALNNLDLSNNSFDPSEAPSWFSDLRNLTTLIVESAGLQGEVPQDLFSLSKLQEVRLGNNAFSGTLNMSSNITRELKTVNFQNNLLTSVTLSSFYNDTLILDGNPVCSNVQLKQTEYCQGQEQDAQANASGSVPCLRPYQGPIICRAPFFGYISHDSLRALEKRVSEKLEGTGVTFVIGDSNFDDNAYLRVQLDLCHPTAKEFTREDILRRLDLNTQDLALPEMYGPCYFNPNRYEFGNSGTRGWIVGVAVGSAAAVFIIAGLGTYALWQKRRAKRAFHRSNPFASWGSSVEEAGGAPQPKGARSFSFDELRKLTNGFSKANEIGSGGYGKVGRPQHQIQGMQNSDCLSYCRCAGLQRTASGRADGCHQEVDEGLHARRSGVQDGDRAALQGASQEPGGPRRLLLRQGGADAGLRVHHQWDLEGLPLRYARDLNGALPAHGIAFYSPMNAGRRSVKLDWRRRVKIALDSARGLAYLHEHANPPIVHRDVKASNILLDDHLTAKVSDFGLSTFVLDSEEGHFSLDVKGTPDDNEYYGLKNMIDPSLPNTSSLDGFRRFAELALQCLDESSVHRPTMNDIVKEIEILLGKDEPDADSTSASVRPPDEMLVSTDCSLLRLALSLFMQSNSRSIQDWGCVTTPTSGQTEMGTLIFTLFVFLVSLGTSAGSTNPQDEAILLRLAAAALRSLMSQWQNTPPNWGESDDPCGTPWEGIGCSNSRVTVLRLSTMGIKGTLSGDIGQLGELKTLILAGCSFSGNIPDELGSLVNLSYLALNSNQFTGSIPASLGKLSNLYWFDVADNQLSGSLPISTKTSPGLDQLVHTKHFHFNKNQLSGSIPEYLFSSDMTLLHVLFDGNKFTGEIPASIGLVQTIEVLRLDRNALSGTVPSNINNLTRINELNLANNKLSGPMPNLTGIDNLNYVDLSNNTFDPSESPAWFSELQSLTALVIESGGLYGEVPQKLFGFPQLQQVILDDNKFNGTLDMGDSISQQLQIVNFTNNHLSGVKLTANYNKTLILVGNPVCNSLSNTNFCSLQQNPEVPYSTSLANCVANLCPQDQSLSPQSCSCAYPFEGVMFFRAPRFRDVTNNTLFQSLESSLWTKLGLPPGSVFLQNPFINSDSYLQVQVKLFPPSGMYFNRSEILQIGFDLSNQTYKPPPIFGPYYFIASPYPFPGTEVKSALSIGLIIGIAVGCALLIIGLLLVVIYALRQGKRAQRAIELSRPFASWARSGDESVDAPQLKGARWFSYDELKQCTNNFAVSNEIGSGGYGKVYRGTLPGGQAVAIKRAQQGSMQGGLEFKTEIELLSRVHHKNLVGLVGFCFDQGEQMLVYEFVPNGTLRESLSGKNGVLLDWRRRLRIALGSARGLAYLHELADPPIIHRDVKSSNILLDENLNAKVADFGLSKLASDNEKGYVSTQVKGTLNSIHLIAFKKFTDLGLRCLEESAGDRPTMSDVVKEIEMMLHADDLSTNSHSASSSATDFGNAKGVPHHPYISLSRKDVNSNAFEYSGGYSFSEKPEPK